MLPLRCRLGCLSALLAAGAVSSPALAQSLHLDVGNTPGWMSGSEVQDARAYSPDAIIDRIQERQALEARANHLLGLIQVGMTRAQLLTVAHPALPYNFPFQLYPSPLTVFPASAFACSANISLMPPAAGGTYDADIFDRVKINVTFRMVNQPQQVKQGELWLPKPSGNDIITSISGPYLSPS